MFGCKLRSDFVQQQDTICDFSTSDSWVILSPIEQSIKRKIEAVGTPLKDWDINIYRGVLTGCNEAFIISTVKRNEILANCQTEEERKRTDELIRPILRGRDIKRYSYEWAELWLIATFPSRHYNIEDYPAVKQYLLSFGIERLEQTGKVHNVNGERIKSRKKTNNKWFETQDSISYWEDFNKPKIIFQEIVQNSQFLYDETIHYMCNDTGRIIVGAQLPFILGVLNSKLFFYAVKKFYSGGVLGEHGIRMKHTFFGNFPCLSYNKQIENAAKELSYKFNTNTADKTDKLIFSAYSLTKEEISEIQGEFM